MGLHHEFLAPNQRFGAYFLDFEVYFLKFKPKISNFGQNIVEIEIFLSISAHQFRANIMKFEQNMLKIAQNGLFLAKFSGF